jgi:hypothetical protein
MVKPSQTQIHQTVELLICGKIFIYGKTITDTNTPNTDQGAFPEESVVLS